MNNIPEKLEKLGFDKCFLESVSPENLKNFEIARVVADFLEEEYELALEGVQHD